VKNRQNDSGRNHSNPTALHSGRTTSLSKRYPLTDPGVMECHGCRSSAYSLDHLSIHLDRAFQLIDIDELSDRVGLIDRAGA